MGYSQGLKPDFISALNDLHASPEGEWWRKMLADPELFIAIRYNYLNVYFRGCSLAKLTLESEQVIAETHYKYLLKPKLPKPYVRATGGQFGLADQWANGLADPFTSHLSDLKALKDAAKVYAGAEKKFVGKVIQAHPNVIDTEIALTKEAEKATETDPGEKASAKRIDIAALRWEGSTPILDFYEAKLFGNKEIRAEKDAEVVDQIKGYEELLKKYADDIREGFLTSCQNIVALSDVGNERREVAWAALKHGDNLRINTEPFLIVGDFDKDQSVGDVWRQHRDKLSKALGPNRVLLAGNAKSVRLKHGSPPSEIAA